MAAALPAVRIPVSPAIRICDTIADYLGHEEDDLILKKQQLYRVFSAATTPWLDWRQRPQLLRDKITTTFLHLAERQKSTWPVDGSPRYRLCGIDECSLLKRIILDAPSSRKDFYVLDVGAGDFQWGKNMAKFIDSQADLPLGITIHIIGIGADRYPEPSAIVMGKCQLTRLDGFKIEDCDAEFDRLRPDVKSKIDFAVSHYCFMHLHDPVGTFVQIYNLLRPGAGIFCCDYFGEPKNLCFFLENSGWEPLWHGSDKNSYLMIQLLIDLGAPFLVRVCEDVFYPPYSFRDLILKRISAEPCALPMQYQVFDDEDKGSLEYRFRREPCMDSLWKISLPIRVEEVLLGSKFLFDDLSSHKLLSKSYPWRPIEPYSATKAAAAAPAS